MKLWALLLALLPFTSVSCSWLVQKKTLEPWPKGLENRKRVWFLPPILGAMSRGFADVKAQLSADNKFRIEKLKDNPNKQIIQKIGKQITKIASKEFGVTPEWDFYLVKNDAVNAIVHPDGKIFVYSGLVNHLVRGKSSGRYRDAETILAFIIAHEIGHILAKHVSEKVSLMMGLKTIDIILKQSLKGSPSSITKSVLLLGKIIGADLLLMKTSRVCEFEADRIGVYLCTQAGYDTKLGLDFFGRGALLSSRRRRGGAPGAALRAALGAALLPVRLPLWLLRQMTATHPPDAARRAAAGATYCALTGDSSPLAQQQVQGGGSGGGEGGGAAAAAAAARAPMAGRGAGLRARGRRLRRRLAAAAGGGAGGGGRLTEIPRMTLKEELQCLMLQYSSL